MSVPKYVLPQAVLCNEIIRRSRMAAPPHDNVSMYSAQFMEVVVAAAEKSLELIQAECSSHDHQDGTPRFRSMVSAFHMIGSRVLFKFFRCLKEWDEPA